MTTALHDTKTPSSLRLRDRCEIARTIFDTGMVEDEGGRSVPVNSEISEVHADALYRTVLARRPRLSVEIGMAHGMSTLAILTALRDAGGEGRLISIDPFQRHAGYGGAGLRNVQRAGLADRHTWIGAYDYLALPELVRDGEVVDFAYIDGWHTFDYTLLDFWYLDRVVPVGGVIGFNDCGMPAVRKVMDFVRTHRRYREIDVGLAPDYRARSPLISLARRLTRASNSDRYFEKREAWEPAWNFFARF